MAPNTLVIIFLVVITTMFLVSTGRAQHIEDDSVSDDKLHFPETIGSLKTQEEAFEMFAIT